MHLPVCAAWAHSRVISGNAFWMPRLLHTWHQHKRRQVRHTAVRHTMVNTTFSSQYCCVFEYSSSKSLIRELNNWMAQAIFLTLKTMGPLGLHVLFFHFTPGYATLGNSFFQMSSYARAYVHMTDEKTEGKFAWENHVVWNGKTKRTI